MNTIKPLRVMWLLNHTTLRQFEIKQLKSLGVRQIFTPKKFPYDEGNLSASVTYEFDATLELTRSELDLLNAQDWYTDPLPEAWDLANRHFDVAFIGFFPKQMLSVCRNFKGSVVLRAFGLGGGATYSRLILQTGGVPLQFAIISAAKRFWFGMGYKHLSECEDEFIADRAIFMPVGMDSVSISDLWKGNDRLVLFVCPRIGSSSYYNLVYKKFKDAFKGIPYLIAGAQPVFVNDPNVLGFVSKERYSELMQQSRVMFYHSQEPNHIHYHPFEAIRFGMPLVFMAGGMLDTMGGRNLPGRCKTLAEARRKIERILSDDWDLIEDIRSSQSVLLDPMKPENCEPAWREGFQRVATELETWRSQQAVRPKLIRRKKVAVIIPIGYRGGTLRGALLLAKALYLGSRQCGEDADVVFAHLGESVTQSEDEFTDLPDGIARRIFNWKILTAAESRRAMRYAGIQGWEPCHDRYMVPDDGMQQLLDCDLWLIVSDRLVYPILPLRPVVLMVFDYLQRYEDILSQGADMPFLRAARQAERVLVTTNFTRKDAIQYAGLDVSKVRKVPMLVPEFPIRVPSTVNDADKPSFFLWTTNASPHKNHRRAAEALQIYYEEFDGQWDCMVTGVNTLGMLNSDMPHLKAMAEVFQRSEQLRKHVKWMGELPDTRYRYLLSKAGFLWHPARIDNGTFSVIEAACLGVPSLSSDYPAMQEINEQFSLNLAWMNPESSRQMAEQLKYMEKNISERRKLLPGRAILEMHRIEHYAEIYWQEIRSCL